MRLRPRRPLRPVRRCVPEAPTLRARRTPARRSTPVPGDAPVNPRHIVVPPETRAFVGAVGRRLALLAALAVLVVCGGDLAAARATDPVLHGPILFMMAFAVCGGVCLIAPERRLRWSGMLVGAANGAFAAATYFATQM